MSGCGIWGGVCGFDGAHPCAFKPEVWILFSRVALPFHRHLLVGKEAENGPDGGLTMLQCGGFAGASKRWSTNALLVGLSDDHIRLGSGMDE